MKMIIFACGSSVLVLCLCFDLFAEMLVFVCVFGGFWVSNLCLGWGLWVLTSVFLGLSTNVLGFVFVCICVYKRGLVV